MDWRAWSGALGSALRYSCCIDEDRLVDCANQFHIFVPVLKDTGEPVDPVGWMCRRATATAEQTEAIGSKQRE